MISPELATFLESGVSILVGTRDARLVPDSARGVGARVETGGRELTVLLGDVLNTTALANLRDNGRIAVCFSRNGDHRSIQVKGKVLSIAPAAPPDRALVERYNGLIAVAWGEIGVPPAAVARWVRWPCHAVRFAVEAVFVQTPGPGAGAPLAAAGGAR